ncbi:MAG: type I-E CRISPR-associated protein Cas6/Cse3/CasE [Shinella sp.]|nr:MAG: type I-E CRISPR-associated protein Cas6/Cse3/CasE [Shinella sp.]
MSEAPLWFTRITLRRDAPDIAPLISRLFPSDESGMLNATHQLLWTLMPEEMQKEGKPERPDKAKKEKAAFLWRKAERDNSWYMLGRKPREDSSFLSVETKPYELSPKAGDMLAFDLTVNATVNRLVDPAKGRDGRQRCDIVMDVLKAHERSVGHKLDRAEQRMQIARPVLSEWLTAQGSRNGFSPIATDLVAYRTVALERRAGGHGRKGGSGASQFGISQLRGLLTVTDPVAFVAGVEQGFGRAKAFGCGLMLLRRVE